MTEVIFSTTNPTSTTKDVSHKGTATSDEHFRKQAMSATELSKLCFSSPTTSSVDSLGGTSLDNNGCSSSTLLDPPANLVSCASSICSNTSHSDRDFLQQPTESISFERQLSDQINGKLLSQKKSRHGRASQRWTTSDSASEGNIRLSTGCVPILQGGKILLVSASKKPEWIIPKGGWESDETMEESALREAFEEAGVMGVIGSQLEQVQHETRKARKRRLEEFLSQQKKQKDTTKLSGEVPPSEALQSSSTSKVETSSSSLVSSVVESSEAPVSDEALKRIRGALHKPNDETSSTASDSVYSHVRLTAFPLYITDVLDSWPEDGRLRKAVEIDEAIEILAKRPELQATVLQVKARGLHRTWRPVPAAKTATP